MGPIWHVAVIFKTSDVHGVSGPYSACSLNKFGDVIGSSLVVTLWDTNLSRHECFERKLFTYNEYHIKTAN